MPVVTDFPFTLDPAPILKRYGREVSALLDRPELRQVYEAALAEARTLIQPGIAYAAHPVVSAEPFYAESIRSPAVTCRTVSLGF